jgi:riboflavin synthase alpha subunit
MQGLPTTTVYTSVTRSRYSNVVNTSNIRRRNTELMYTRGSIALQGVSLCQGRNGCLD